MITITKSVDPTLPINEVDPVRPSGSWMAAKSPPENKFGSFNKERKTCFEAPEEAHSYWWYHKSSVTWRVDYNIRSVEFLLCRRAKKLCINVKCRRWVLMKWKIVILTMQLQDHCNGCVHTGVQVRFKVTATVSLRDYQIAVASRATIR